MKKLLLIILYSLLTILLITNIFSYFNLSFFGFRTFIVASGSMEPTLKVGDMILVKSEKTYEVGDIVTYSSKNSYVTHRIVQINSDDVITRGDINNTNDPSFSKDLILGKVIYKFKVLNFINFLFRKPLVWFLLFIVGIMVTILMPDKKSKI